MADPIIDVWSRKIETPHHGYWQGGYREDSRTKWCELRVAWPSNNQRTSSTHILSMY